MSRKKSFKMDNPAMQFISQAEEAPERTEKEENTSNTHNEYINATQKETKSKRLNLLIHPSLYQDLTKIAYMKKISLNELVFRTMKDCADQNKKMVQKYDALLTDEQ